MKVDGRDGRDPQNRKKNAPAGRFTCMKCSSDSSNACRTESANCNPNAAAINSSLGMLSDVNGATLDFAAINRTDNNPFLYTCLAYTTDPSASWEASTNL